MNKIEKLIYDLVKSNPKLKSTIRNIYQSFFDLLPDKDNFSIDPIIVKEGYFFGFHDISPFSIDEKYVLSNKLEIPLRMPTSKDPLTVGYWDEDLNIFTPVKQTFAWNYHKGCRLQWLGQRSDKFIYNDIVDGHLGSSIYTITDKSIRNVDYPIDTVSPNGKYATSFSYERLNRYMPGYGYICKDEPYFDEPESDKTGLFLIDLEKNERKLIVTLNELAQTNSDRTMIGAHHYVTHTKFSQDSERLAFLHRWTYDNPDKRYSRLITCKLDGSDIQISATTGMVSHYDWDSECGILAYCQVNGVDGHFVFNDYRMKTCKRVAICLNSDGHQSYVHGSNKFITDTYPDKRRHAKLYLGDIDSDNVKLLADLKSPKKFQSPTLNMHWACDLHPRVSPSDKYICFDSVHTGVRSFCIMSLEDILKGCEI